METVVTLLVVGGVLLVLETVLPGMIAGIIGGLCLAAGVIMSYTTFGSQTGNWILLGVVLVTAAGTVGWLRYFPNSPMGRALVSEQTIGTVGVQRNELLDQTGTAFTNLRPSGTALINHKRVDVVADGVMIERGTPVKVVAVEGSRVVVRALT